MPRLLRFLGLVPVLAAMCIGAPARAQSPDFFIQTASITVTGDPSSPCNFNGTAVPCPDYIWFSTVLKLQATNLAPVTIFLRNQHITFTANSISYDLPVANSATTFDPAATTATTNYAGTWSTVVPSGASGNQFAAGLPWPVPCPDGLPKSVTVTWTADFFSDKANASVNWTWSAAAYSSFNGDPSALGVKASDDNHFAPYANSDHAGTPENYKGNVVGGGTGGGGSNYTGSLCSTLNVPSPTGARQATWGSLKTLYR